MAVAFISFVLLDIGNAKSFNMVVFTPAQVLTIGLGKAGRNVGLGRAQETTKIRRFQRHYGPNPTVVSLIWSTLQTTTVPDAIITKRALADFVNFLMALHHLKAYPVEEVLANRFDVHEQTARKWVHFYIKKLAALKESKVKWPNPLGASRFIISVDCVNFGVNEPRHPFLHKVKEYFDRKGGKAGVTYEIALDLWSSRVVWMNGPFPAATGDQVIFTDFGLQAKMPAGTKAIADKIYESCDKIASHNSLDTDEVRDFKARARARQESINARLKSFGCLKQRFRHDIRLHNKDFVHACMVICCFELENGSPLFNI